MGRERSFLLFLLLLLFSLNAFGEVDGGIEVRLLEFPRDFSSSAAAAFEFEILESGSENSCRGCIAECKLDDQAATECQSRKVNYSKLLDGPHKFEVCAKGSSGANCSSYNWIVDTIPPTASISTPFNFTSAENTLITISFSEPCTSGGRFQCSERNCNVLVYGSGRVLPTSLDVLQPDLKYSLTIYIPPNAVYGRLVVVMDKNFCSDEAGNLFTRTENSILFLRYDRRPVTAEVNTWISERQIPINGVPRIVRATNNDEFLRAYVNFSVPVVNSSIEILRALRTSSGAIIPVEKNSLGNRRFTFKIENVSRISVITLNLDATSIISRQGTPVLPTEPVVFLYDAERPSVTLSTPSSSRTREKLFSVLVKFVKPVFGFNSSAIEISGGTLRSFREASRSIYFAEIHADKSEVSIKVLDNQTVDVAGNQNLASNVLYYRHYSTPLLSALSSGVITVIFWATCIVATVLAVSTARLLSSGFLPQPSAYFISEPTRNLVRTAFHIQVFAQSRWLGIDLPVEFYEFARGLQWSIPYLRLPWESKSDLGDSGFLSAGAFSALARGVMPAEDLLYGVPLSAMEYTSFFENQGTKPEASSILSSRSHDEWREFGRNMFWLAIISASLLAIHALLLLILKIQRKKSAAQTNYGSLTFPRFQLFLAFLALPCISQASTTILVQGNSPGSAALGLILLVIVGLMALSLLIFVSYGISMGKLLEYKEVHQVGQKFHFLQDIIRVSLGPGKRGQWTWKKQQESQLLTKLGPLFEDIRGPPKYMLTQFAAGEGRSRRSASLIDSDDENEDAEAPCLQKLFGILRIYYPVIETIKRLIIGAVAGARSQEPSRKLIILCLTITSFQLFFLLLKKPFIKKKTQLVEILAVAGEVAVLGCCLKVFSGERTIGKCLIFSIVGIFFMQMVVAWYAMWKQVRRLSSGDESFFSGVRNVGRGLLVRDLEGKISPPAEGGDSGVAGRPWLSQLREMAKASFSRDEGAPRNSSSASQNVWGGLWSGKRSGSSSMTSSSVDAKPRPRALEKDFEAIFSSRQ